MLYVIAIDLTGGLNAEQGKYDGVYATADSREQAHALCEEFCSANPEAYAEILLCREAELIGLLG